MESSPLGLKRSSSTFRRRAVPLSDITIHLVEQHEAVLRHVLFWLQEQTYFRQRWHHSLSTLPLFEVVSLVKLQRLLVEIVDATEQFPFGFAPSEEAFAERLSFRLHLLWHEVHHLQKLVGVYIARTADAGVRND
ncbi:MAG: hypothetical protein ACI9DF_005634 [Verrucomicrobiales bacterium]|jgi:hypothetical protein